MFSQAGKINKINQFNDDKKQAVLFVVEEQQSQKILLYL